MVLRNSRDSVILAAYWETCARLRRLREREDVPIILLIHNTNKPIRLVVASKSCGSSTFRDLCIQFLYDIGFSNSRIS